MKNSSRIIVALGLSLFGGWAVRSPAAPLGSAFTYQGRLTDGGAPANGTYDLRFILYDADVGGSQVGSIVTKDDTAVANGLFSVTLDFGAGAFDSAARWLDIAVRPGGSAGFFTPLVPRQQVTPAPQALYAVTAASATTATTANTANLATTATTATRATTADAATTANSAPWSGLTGVPAGFADGVDNDTLYQAGPGLSLNDGQFGVTYAGNGAAATASRSDHHHDGAYATSTHLHSGADITAGTLADARLSPSVALLNRAQTFTAAQNFETSANDTPLTVRGAVTQTANLQEWRDSAGLTLASVGPAGVISAAGFNGDGSGLTGLKLGNNSVFSAHLADGSVTTPKLADNAVSSAKLAADTVSTAHLQDKSVTSAKLANAAVGSLHLRDQSVTGDKLAPGILQAAALADGSVTTAKLADLAVTTAKLADFTVTEAKLSNGAVTREKLAAGAVGPTELADGAVTTDELADAAVVSAKLAFASVTGDHLQDFAVGNNKLAPLAVTSDKIAGQAVGAPELADGAVNGDKVQPASLELRHLAGASPPVTPGSGLLAVTPALVQGSVLLTQPEFDVAAFNQVIAEVELAKAVPLSAHPFVLVSVRPTDLAGGGKEYQGDISWKLVLRSIPPLGGAARNFGYVLQFFLETQPQPPQPNGEPAPGDPAPAGSKVNLEFQALFARFQ